jgi:hypothetical protein
LDSLAREEHTLTVFQNRVPRRLFESERELATAGERKLYTEELNIVQACTSNIIKMDELREIGWVGHIARTGEMSNANRILIGESKENGLLEYLSVSGRKILKWIYFKKKMYGLDSC